MIFSVKNTYSRTKIAVVAFLIGGWSVFIFWGLLVFNRRQDVLAQRVSACESLIEEGC